jgi:hypothetical protein
MAIYGYRRRVEDGENNVVSPLITILQRNFALKSCVYLKGLKGDWIAVT